jgi:hypothetical protein
MNRHSNTLVHKVAPILASVPAGTLQRKCACGQHSVGKQCDECKKKDSTLQRSAVGTAAQSAVPPVVHEVLRSPGQPLDGNTRGLMQERFGRDFSHVRVHTDALAAASASAVRASAYTVGRDIVFASERYAPHSSAGKSLLAHELTHVLQQNQDEGSRSGPLQISDDQAHESEASAAESMTLQSSVQTSALALQRSPEDAAKQCGGTWTCAAGPCDKPDPGREGNGGNATDWKLTVMIDAEAPSADDVKANTVGHTYVEFSDSSGAAYTYGFYPNKAFGTPDPVWHQEVFGCMVHPDTNHASCVDYKETFKLTQQEYTAALSFAQLFCRVPPKYHLRNYNCTTFVKDVADRAKRSLPPVRGKVSEAGVMTDNPYTLIENLRRRDIGPTYNLKSDTELRDAIKSAGKPELAKIPPTEKIRVINRLVDGYFSDDDLAAIEKLCESVSTAAEIQQINKAVQSREKELNKRQAPRFHSAISRNIGSTP